MTETRAGIGNVARNRALIEMAMGYSRSRVLCAAARLGIADALGDDERSVEQLAAACGAQPASLYRLLRALASFGIISERIAGRFVLTPLGKPLRKDVPNSEWAGVVFWSDLLADSWSYLTECVRTGENAARIMERQGAASRWATDPEASGIFRAVMGTAPSEDYMPIARAWDFSKYRTVADLGGGGGALIAAILNVFPKLEGMLVDRADSVKRAISRFESEGLAARCKLVAADLCESVPPGADVYMLKHVLHGYTDDSAVSMLRKCQSVLPKEGRVLVIEFVLPDVVDHADPELERRFMSDLNMLAVTAGKERSSGEWKKLLNSADFECQGIMPVAGELVSIIEAARRV
jgi:ubiquinone/menaquinone biosynthesis C-methylase UbiE